MTARHVVEDRIQRLHRCTGFFLDSKDSKYNILFPVLTF